MAVNLKNPEAERLLQELSAATGESLTEAAVRAFAERLARLKQEQARLRGRQRADLLALIAEARAATQPLDARPLKAIRDELWGDDTP
jgi:antitoxin VapB